MKETETTGKSSMAVNISTEDGITDDSSAFMEEVETYMTYKIASYIKDYWFPVLVPLGLFGNTLSFLVMTKPNNRNVSTCIYMAAISVNDNFMMCLVFHVWLIDSVNIHIWNLWECKVVASLHNFSLQSATYQVLAMTVDKYIAIKWPHRAATYSTPKRAKLISCCVFVCTFCYNVPILFVTSLLGGQCAAYVVGGTITRVYSWISFIVNGIIPFSMLIYMNSVIVKTVRKSRKMFKARTATASKESNLGMDTRQKTMKSAENQLTIMLLLVTLLFSLLLIPTYIRFIYLTFAVNDTPAKFAGSMLLFHISYKLYATNSGVNFYLYCISGQKFRHDLKEILCCTSYTFHSMSEAKKRKSQSLAVISCSNA